MCIKDMDEDGLRAADMAFSTPSAAGHDVSLSSKHSKIATDNRAEYIRLALNYRSVSTAGRGFLEVCSRLSEE